MSQERLSALGIRCSKSDKVRQTNFNEFLDDFVMKKARAKSFSLFTVICSALLDSTIAAFYVLISVESRIIFLPERSSICQYLPKMSAINIKKQSRARLLLAHPVLYILKIQKTYGTFWKPPFQN